MKSPPRFCFRRQKEKNMATIRVTELSDTDKVVIRNLVNYPVVIVTPIHRKRWEIPPHGEMEVMVVDVRECSYDQGCRNIFRDYVQICNPELAKEFGIYEDVVEYNWGDKEITEALTTAPIEVLLDALDFAPDGIKEAILDKAVELEISDMDRREAISNALGVNVTNKIDNARKSKTTTAATAKTAKRRVVSKSTATKTRRVATEE